MFHKIENHYKKLTFEATDIQSRLNHLPEGKLICVPNGSYVKWYHSLDGNITYIPKSQKDFAEKLAIKTYLLHRLHELQQELKSLNFYLRHHKESVMESTSMLAHTSPYAPLLTKYFKPISDELDTWAMKLYESNPSHPEQLVHKTCNNLLVRSKSEAQIAMYLYTNKIPFRYETPLVLDGHIIYPDFTIRHPITGDFFYWEHYGLWDYEDYRRQAFSKLQLFSHHGIYPGINLITTYETKQHPLSHETIEAFIQLYFS